LAHGRALQRGRASCILWRLAGAAILLIKLPVLPKGGLRSDGASSRSVPHSFFGSKSELSVAFQRG